jgi:hypothetical protein
MFVSSDVTPLALKLSTNLPFPSEIVTGGGLHPPSDDELTRSSILVSVYRN